jgi:hypothetical protein
MDSDSFPEKVLNSILESSFLRVASPAPPAGPLAGPDVLNMASFGLFYTTIRSLPWPLRPFSAAATTEISKTARVIIDFIL